MSRSKKTIERRVEYSIVRYVTINRGGPIIGKVVRWGIKGTLAYLTGRKHPSKGAKGKGHYFINHRGFGIDKALIIELLNQDGIKLIIFEYDGPKGLRYFIANIEDWVMHAVPASHVKDMGNVIETYGSQMILCEDYMDELEVKYY